MSDDETRPFKIQSPGRPGLYFYEGDAGNCARRLLPATAWPKTEALEWLLSLLRGDVYSGHEGTARVEAARLVVEHAQDAVPATVFNVDRSRQAWRGEEALVTALQRVHDAAHELKSPPGTWSLEVQPPPASDRPHTVFVVEVAGGGAGKLVVGVAGRQEAAKDMAAEDAGHPLDWQAMGPSTLAAAGPRGSGYTITCHGVRVR